MKRVPFLFYKRKRIEKRQKNVAKAVNPWDSKAEPATKMFFLLHFFCSKTRNPWESKDTLATFL